MLKPGVAAALIVRNEARHLRDCLASLDGLVDDIVVIDTGSCDETLEIAREFPVRIGQFVWCDDFSAARNYAIAQVEHEWVLYIDADERLIIPDFAAFRQMLVDASKVAWKLWLHPRVGWTAYTELRLFRNDPRIRFNGEIHERVHPAVNAVCREDGLGIGLACAGLQHVGYEDDQRPKLARNIPLLQSYLARDPSRIYCWWHLGEQFHLAGDEVRARDAWENGVTAVRRQAPAETAISDSMPFTSLIASRHLAGLPVEALLEEALQCFPGHYALQWMAGKHALECGALTQASEIFTRLASINATDYFDEDLAYDKALFTHIAQESLGLTAFRAGDFALAAAHYQHAAMTAPAPMPLRIKAALAAARALRTAEQSLAQGEAITP